MTFKEIIVEYLPWVLSAITIYMTWLQGNKSRTAWVIGWVAQVLWTVWILTSQNWGLVPLNISLWVLYTRNYFKWSES